MSKQNVLLILCALLLSLSLGAAVAEESRTVVWRVTAPAINAEALQTETFGTDLSAVQEEKREYDSLFWSLTGEGIPFCGIDHNRGAENMQARFDIYRHADAGEERTYYYNLYIPYTYICFQTVRCKPCSYKWCRRCSKLPWRVHYKWYSDACS